MLVLRPIRKDDLEALYALTALSTDDLTTLPRDRELLAKRIERSARGFAKLSDEPPAGEEFLFVLEDLASARIVGTSAIVSKVGGFEPFYAYRIETTVRESRMLGIRKEIDVLHLVRMHSGPCEIGSLLLHPDWRGGNGRLLSLSRFLFMADFPDIFEPTVIAEMRGVVDEAGRSPFWEGLGRHFFDIDYPHADYLSIVDKRFISELMPEHPIYIPLLPKEAQEVIGQVHPRTRPGLALLLSEGFRRTGMVDIFEAGPIVRCEAAEIRTVRESAVRTVRDLDPALDEAPPDHLLSNRRRAFRACRGAVRARGDEVDVGPRVADALQLRAGETLRFVRAKTSAGTMRETEAAS